MLNTVILIGRLTQDPELRYTPNGVAVAQFTVAVDRPFTDQNGKRETDFIDCLAWRKLGRMPHFSWKLKLAIPMALWFTREVYPIMKEESLVTSSIMKEPRPEQMLTVPWVDILHDAQDGLLALSVRIGLQVLQQMMATEVEQLAGPKGRHDAHRQAVRCGTEPKPVI